MDLFDIILGLVNNSFFIRITYCFHSLFTIDKLHANYQALNSAANQAKGTSKSGSSSSGFGSLSIAASNAEFDYRAAMNKFYSNIG